MDEEEEDKRHRDASCKLYAGWIDIMMKIIASEKEQGMSPEMILKIVLISFEAICGYIFSHNPLSVELFDLMMPEIRENIVKRIEKEEGLK